MRVRRRTFLIFLAGVGLSPVLLRAQPQSTQLYLPLVQQLARFYPPENATYEQEVARLINLERAKRNLSLLTFDAELVQAARRQSADLASHSMRGHTGSDGSTAFDRMRETGYVGTPWTETAGYGGWVKPTDIVNAWLQSPPHRAILLMDVLTDIGVGYSTNPKSSFYTTYWIADFGVRR